ncbi:MAG: S41 family peptidase [Firmicutes bacterium]|nr:S41 family peptidase [Bacillota bacterium]
MQMKKQSFTILLIAVFLAGCAAALGSVLLVEKGVIGETVKVAKDKYGYYQQLDQRYAKLNQLYDDITVNYYKEPKVEDLETGMYKGLVAGLGDPYSAYMTSKEFQSWNDQVLGEFEGIGINFSMNSDGEFVILSSIPNTPAEAAGLRAGDRILAVDGKMFSDVDLLSSAIKGKAGTKVSIIYERNGKQKEVSMKRAKIVTQTVTGKMLKKNIGYIALSSFEEHTAEDFKAQVSALEKKGAENLVIDLRDNGGGLMNSGVEIADYLLGEGTITYLQDRQGRKEYISSDKNATDLQCAFLVNENTASTSEILAAAVKDDGTHFLVGTTTFGKGIVQSSQQRQDGSALKLTTMQYFSPKGHVIHEKGIKPDYVVKADEKDKQDKQLNKAVQVLETK